MSKHKRQEKHKRQKAAKKTIVIYRGPTKISRPDAKLVAAAIQQAQEIEQHFRKDGWPLNYDLYVAELYHSAKGHDLSDYLWNELCKKRGYTIYFENNKFLLTKKRKSKRGKNKQAKNT